MSDEVQEEGEAGREAMSARRLAVVRPVYGSFGGLMVRERSSAEPRCYWDGGGREQVYVLKGI
jgi:hypothetical protein